MLGQRLRRWPNIETQLGQCCPRDTSFSVIARVITLKPCISPGHTCTRSSGVPRPWPWPLVCGWSSTVFRGHNYYEIKIKVRMSTFGWYSRNKKIFWLLQTYRAGAIWELRLTAGCGLRRRLIIFSWNNAVFIIITFASENELLR